MERVIRNAAKALIIKDDVMQYNKIEWTEFVVE